MKIVWDIYTYKQIYITCRDPGNIGPYYYIIITSCYTFLLWCCINVGIYHCFPDIYNTGNIVTIRLKQTLIKLIFIPNHNFFCFCLLILFIQIKNKKKLSNWKERLVERSVFLMYVVTIEIHVILIDNKNMFAKFSAF